MGRGQGKQETAGAATRRGDSNAPGSQDLSTTLLALAIIPESATAREAHLQALRPALQDLCHSGLNPTVRAGIFDKLRSFGLNMSEESKRDFEETLLDGAPEDFLRAWGFHQSGNSRLPLTQQAEAIATRVVVDAASSRFPETLHDNGAEVIRANAEAEGANGHLSSLLDKHGLTPSQAAEHMSVGAWTQVLRNWDHDRFQTTGSSREVFCRELEGSLRRTIVGKSRLAAA